MIDKIASWKFAEDYAIEPESIRLARQSAQELGVESVTAATGAQLAMLAAAVGARNLVEIGTGAGISGLWLLQSSDQSVLTTIDSEPEYQNVARQNFKNAEIAPNRVRVIAGQAASVIGNMAESAYDLAFIDVDPLDLEAILPTAIALVRPGGIVAIAHALWRDRVPNPTLRDDESVALRSVLRGFSDSAAFLPSLSMVGDGLLIVAKR